MIIIIVFGTPASKKQREPNVPTAKSITKLIASVSGKHARQNFGMFASRKQCEPNAPASRQQHKTNCAYEQKVAQDKTLERLQAKSSTNQICLRAESIIKLIASACKKHCMTKLWNAYK